MIKVIDSLYLTEKGCSIKNRKFYPVHIRQGELDGACSVYALMMNLLILKAVSRNQLEDLYNKIKKSPEVEHLFHEFFDKHGLVRGGFYFDRLKKIINRFFGEIVTADYFDCETVEPKGGFIKQIQDIIDTNLPIILGIDFKGGGAHAVVAIGYEHDEEGVFNIFCLDPGYSCSPTSYWNMVISLDVFIGKYKHQCLTDNPYNCPAINIMNTLVIKKNK